MRLNARSIVFPASSAAPPEVGWKHCATAAFSRSFEKGGCQEIAFPPTAPESVSTRTGVGECNALGWWTPTENGGTYQLAQEGPGRNAGVALPNFNLGDREEGGAADLGAHEFNAPDMQFGVKANWVVP